MGNALNLRKLFVVEIAIIIVAIVTVAVFVEISPFLSASNQTGQIGVYNQRQYAQNTVTLERGQRVSSMFNYTTYDPAILVVDLTFKDWQKEGTLTLYCNGIPIDTFEATPNNPSVQSTMVTFSGFDLVKPPPSKLAVSSIFTYGNEISFVSAKNNGYEGTFSYQVNIRGSR
jgi:type II secretory pathway pseudopilin PulG